MQAPGYKVIPPALLRSGTGQIDFWVNDDITLSQHGYLLPMCLELGYDTNGDEPDDKEYVDHWVLVHLKRTLPTASNAFSAVIHDTMEGDVVKNANRERVAETLSNFFPKEATVEITSTKVLAQEDAYNCGVYVILHGISLVQYCQPNNLPIRKG
ncbi:hypothetical protein PFICI_07583 [Pestalotiopsis fici W106-1]|uniref:Ubiquitin-like protease family profile domain-containing protein n=1 Tax=Pestalotiopsis fici (strain W106-1 / CGMCC3.15140) TaxID=1229662 RepID=W3X212_PESFW|nr:uncharacterized protein PFICI_07583 [Pestalotiopsis fici W106-1]ETS80054.1 hypothetical protein PFICI_07583 [Pestalotiopsis fici W106-1]